MFPGIIIILPTVFSIYFAMPEIYSVLRAFLLTLAITSALLFLVGAIVRYKGRKVEPRLFAEWGGTPTTRILRWSDNTHSDQWKEKIHNAIFSLIKIKLLSKSA